MRNFTEPEASLQVRPKKIEREEIHCDVQRAEVQKACGKNAPIFMPAQDCDWLQCAEQVQSAIIRRAAEEYLREKGEEVQTDQDPNRGNVFPNHSSGRAEFADNAIE